MASKFVIRTGTEADIDPIRRVEVAAGRLFAGIGMESIADDEPPTIGELTAHCEDDTLWVAVAEDNTVAGYAMASVVDGQGHLDQVSVVPEQGRRGIGRALVERVITWAVGRGYASVTLTTFRDVEWNGPYYERLGFLTVDDSKLGPELAELRRRETADGLDVAPRVVMRRISCADGI